MTTKKTKSGRKKNSINIKKTDINKLFREEIKKPRRIPRSFTLSEKTINALEEYKDQLKGKYTASRIVEKILNDAFGIKDND